MGGPTLSPGNNGQLTPPKVPPQNGGSGKTVVDTACLDTFADNMGKLIGPVKDALNQLNTMEPVAAGLFADAQNIETKVTGIPSNSSASSGSSSGGGGGAQALQSNFITVLTDLANGLTDLQKAANAMSTKYTTADDLNSMSVTDLQNSLSDSTSDFGNMMTANGGTPETTPPPAPGAPGAGS